jgi:hypothetical protein
MHSQGIIHALESFDMGLVSAEGKNRLCLNEQHMLFL